MVHFFVYPQNINLKKKPMIIETIESDFGLQVLEDLKTAFLQKKNCDVIIYVGEEPNVEIVHAHSFILRMRSSYFDSVLSPTWFEMKDGKFVFKKPNISKLVFQKILL